MFRKILKKINFLFYNVKTDILKLFIRKGAYHIAIVSSEKYANKLWDDIYLKRQFISNKVFCDIISWEKSIDLDKYDGLVIRSIWGFCDNLDNFNSWLVLIEKSDIKVFNDIELIRNNIDKKSQFMLMDKYNIEHVETVFLNNTEYIVEDVKKVLQKQFANYDRVVIKPSISESGYNTYLIGNDGFKNSIEVDSVYNAFLNCNSSLMLQPFIEGVLDGEISVICIKGQIVSAVKRYCSIFGNKSCAVNLEISELDENLVNACNKIISIPEYNNHIYMRIDFVNNNSKYQVIEIELIDPNLFISFIKDDINRKKLLNRFVSSILDEIKK